MVKETSEIEKLQQEIEKLQKRLDVYEGPSEPVSADEEKKRVRKVFDMFDTDKSGDLDAKEFQQLSFALGETITLDQAKERITEIDLDRNGKIDFHEFYTWWKSPDHSFLTQSNKGKEMMVLKAKLTSQNYMRTVSRLAQNRNEKQKNVGKEEAAPTSNSNNNNNTETKVPKDIATFKSKIDVGEMKEAACSVDMVYIDDEKDCKEYRDYVGGKTDSIMASFSASVQPQATDFQLGEISGAAKVLLGELKKEVNLSGWKIELGKEDNTRVFKLHLIWDKNKKNKDDFEEIQQVIEALHPKSAKGTVWLDQSPQKQKTDQTLQGKLVFESLLYKNSVELFKELLELDEDEDEVEPELAMLKLLEAVNSLDLSFKFDTFQQLYAKIVSENKRNLYRDLEWPEGWEFGLNFWTNVKPLLLKPLSILLKEPANKKDEIPPSIIEAYFDALNLFRGLVAARVQMGNLALSFKADQLDVVHLFPNRSELEKYMKDQEEQKKKGPRVNPYSSRYREPDWEEEGTKSCMYGFEKDGNGAVATLRRSEKPAVATSSSIDPKTKVKDFLNRENVYCRTAAEPQGNSPWFMCDLGHGRRLVPNHYVFHYASTGSALCPRNWKLQATNDSKDLSPNGANWVTLHEAKDDRSFEAKKKDFATRNFKIADPKGTEGFRFFRIIKTGPTSYSKPDSTLANTLVAGGFDVYGSLHLAVEEPVSNNFEFSFENDTNGIVHFLGTSSKHKPPRVVSSSQDRGQERDFIERGVTTHCWTQNKPNSFFLVDFGKGSAVTPNYYSWRYGSSVPPRAKPCCARSWKLQGANDDAAKVDFSPTSDKWTDLDIQDNNETLSGAYSTYSSAIDPKKGSFRYFRLIQTGKNASTSSKWCNVLVASGFEIYGHFTSSPPSKEEEKKNETQSASSFSGSGSSDLW